MTDTKYAVHEAYTRDTGRGVIRIDKKTMDDLMVTSGDVIMSVFTRSGYVMFFLFFGNLRL